MASRFMSMGRSGTPVEFIIARDDSSQRVLDVMGTQVAQMVTGTPQPAVSPHSEQSTAERLQVLESLHAGGVITEAEFARKREQIIVEL